MVSNDDADDLKRFEALIGRCERLSARQLHFLDYRDLARLYRRQTTRLARARHRQSDPDVARHLNALCVRAYTLLYADADKGARSDRGTFLGRLPVAVGRSWGAIVIAWALLATGVVVGAALVDQDPAAIHSLMPSGMGYEGNFLERLVEDPEARRTFLEPEAVAVSRNAIFGTMLFAHNTRVGLLAFAVGILAGLPTVLLQLYQGIPLGALGFVFMRDGTGIPFLAWILPHGIPEFTAIVLCAAGGLIMGQAVAAPGRLGRVRALRAAVDSALLLFGAAIPLFFCAALIESFIRESALGLGSRFAVAGVMAALLGMAMIWVRRQSRVHPTDSGWLYEFSPHLHTGSPGSD